MFLSSRFPFLFPLLSWTHNYFLFLPTRPTSTVTAVDKTLSSDFRRHTKHAFFIASRLDHYHGGRRRSEGMRHPDTNWEDGNSNALDSCLPELGPSPFTHNMAVVCFLPKSLQGINILIIWITGSSDERA